jgi:hypothetical protein
MNKLLITLIITLGLSASYASSHKDSNTKPISESKIKRMDHRLTKHKAVKRNFKTHKEFKRTLQRNVPNKHSKHVTSKSMRYHTGAYDNGYNYNRANYRDDYRPIRQRGYTHSNRGWMLAYKYDRASFYDNQGYFYGYFNRYGYYFEDVFYSYDRYYTYRDRVRGRGSFDNRYYMPANARYYGFCETRHNNRNYERGYDRY